MHGCSVNQAGRVLRALNFVVNSCGPRGPAEPEPVPHRKKRRSSFGRECRVIFTKKQQNLQQDRKDEGSGNSINQMMPHYRMTDLPFRGIF